MSEARALHELVQAQGREGALGHRPGRACARDDRARLEEGRDPYGPGSFPRPYLPGENDGQAPVAGSNEGQGSLTQADATPGAEPTKKPEGGA